jgi:hypothetical protein
MRRIVLATSLFGFAAFLTSVSASAQPSTTATATVTSASSGHGRGMGVGAVTMLNGTSGALFTWGSAGGGLHVDGLFGLRHYRDGGTTNNTTSFSLGGRFWYHVHAASFADFSLGGGLGITSWTLNPGTGASDNRLDLSLEVGGQIRAFLVPNVALLADLGLGATFGNDDNFLIGGHSFGGGGEPEGVNNQFVVGTLGIAYFFE